MSKLFVTGATGRLGSALLSRLAPRHDVRALVRLDSVAAREQLVRLCGDPVRDAFACESLRLVVGDLTRDGLGLSQGERAAQARGLDAIVHLAALTDFSDHGDDRHREINELGALRIAELAASESVPLIFVSTAYVCGEHDGRFDEVPVADAARFRNPYERSKARAEERLAEYCARRGVPLTILRPGVILPEAPDEDLDTGPGPLVFLEFLTGLDGRVEPGAPRRSVRFRGDPDGALNLVGLNTVIDVLERAIEDPTSGIFHVTSAEPTPFREMVEELTPYLSGLRFELVDAPVIEDLDRIERALARHCRAYESYLFATTRHDRTRCESTFGRMPNFDRKDLARVFSNHAAAWRRIRFATAAEPRPAAARSVAEYFDRFLPRSAGNRMVPGIETLTAQFTVSVPGVGIFHLAIENGVLVSVARADRRSDQIDYESEASALLEAVRGAVRPAELFFQNRVTIRGDLHRALSTAVALEEFFKLHPFVESRTA